MVTGRGEIINNLCALPFPKLLYPQMKLLAKKFIPGKFLEAPNLRRKRNCKYSKKRVLLLLAESLGAGKPKSSQHSSGFSPQPGQDPQPPPAGFALTDSATSPRLCRARVWLPKRTGQLFPPQTRDGGYRLTLGPHRGPVLGSHSKTSSLRTRRSCALFLKWGTGTSFLLGASLRCFGL